MILFFFAGKYAYHIDSNIIKRLAFNLDLNNYFNQMLSVDFNYGFSNDKVYFQIKRNPSYLFDKEITFDLFQMTTDNKIYYNYNNTLQVLDLNRHFEKKYIYGASVIGLYKNFLLVNLGNIIHYYDIELEKFTSNFNLFTHHWSDINENYLYATSRKAYQFPNDFYKFDSSIDNSDLKKCNNFLEKNFFYDDILVKFDIRNKKIFKSVSILDLILKHSQLKSLLDFNVNTNLCSDAFHANNVYVLKDERDLIFKNSEMDDVLVTLRELDLVILIDKNFETIKWYVQGVSHRHHSAIIHRNNGTVLIFDNKYMKNNNEISRIIEISPLSKEIVGSYEGSDKHYFYSPEMGRLQYISTDEIYVTSNFQGEVFSLKCNKKPLNDNCDLEFIFQTKNEDEIYFKNFAGSKIHMDHNKNLFDIIYLSFIYQKIKNKKNLFKSEKIIYE